MRGLVKISSQEETRPTDPDPRPLLLSIETPSGPWTCAHVQTARSMAYSR